MKHKILKYSAVCSGLLLAFSAHAIEEGFSYHGYAKGGIGITNDDKLSTGGYAWANNGMNIFRLDGNTYTNSSGGRLGNEANWLEMHTAYGWAMKNDMNWAVKANIVYGEELALDELFVQGSGVIPSNPSATVWAGKRYYNRVETFLTDSQSMSNDGLGFGMDNYDLGFGKFHLGLTRNLYDESPDTAEMIAFTSSITGIQLAENLEWGVYANYGSLMGPDKDTAKQSLPEDAFQVATKFRYGDWSSYDELFIRYSSNANGSMTRSWNPEPQHQIGGFWQGYKELTENLRLSYIWQHETEKHDEESRSRNGVSYLESNWNAFVVRPSYVWSERWSTELEAGYEMIDFKEVNPNDDGTNSGYKITLAQNLHIGSGFWDRPVIRFFVTYAEQDNEISKAQDWYQDADGNWMSSPSNPLGKSDALTFGAQFEAWW
ncbi:carbohydrate porin [Vibrio agarivorans]|uniref:Carbohydrate porin n=1 Tax=Vibrio agarivorans TaxID=153622 RepID=A0ABT7Y4W2_9VIBR|nr:carbohydrate porin [Vibrio agarivorans]MDN2483032.1 carbohydrate porin [Vibrio agarivorans]